MSGFEEEAGLMKARMFLGAAGVFGDAVEVMAGAGVDDPRRAAIAALFLPEGVAERVLVALGQGDHDAATAVVRERYTVLELSDLVRSELRSAETGLSFREALLTSEEESAVIAGGVRRITNVLWGPAREEG